MSRTAGALAALALLGCRFGFDVIAPDGQPPPDDVAVAIDPPVPAVICNVDRLDVAMTSPIEDLAVAPMMDGYAAVWLAGGVANGLTFAPRGEDGHHRELTRGTIPAFQGTRIAGLAATGSNLTVVGADSAGESVRVIARDFQGAPLQSLALTGQAASRDSLPSGNFEDPAHGAARLFVSTVGDTFELRYVAAIDGTINATAQAVHAVSGTVSQLVCDDAKDHAHCSWASTASGVTTCHASDFFLNFPSPPTAGSPSDLASCGTLADATGEGDTVMTVVVTPEGQILADHLSSMTSNTLISGQGLAARTRYGDHLFWIAWLDAERLHLTSLDVRVAPPIATDYPLDPGWLPSSPDALALVRRKPTASAVALDLAIVRKATGTFHLLSICDPP